MTFNSDSQFLSQAEVFWKAFIAVFFTISRLRLASRDELKQWGVTSISEGYPLLPFSGIFVIRAHATHGDWNTHAAALKQGYNPMDL